MYNICIHRCEERGREREREGGIQGDWILYFFFYVFWALESRKNAYVGLSPKYLSPRYDPKCDTPSYRDPQKVRLILANPQLLKNPSMPQVSSSLNMFVST